MNSKIYKYLAIGACALAFTTINLNAQQQISPCGTSEAMLKWFALHPELQAEHEQLLQNSRANLANYRLTDPVSTLAVGPPTYIIPVVFHIIYGDGGNANHTFGTENISDAQVQDEMNILNTDYRKINYAGTGTDTANITAPFRPIAADTKIEFRLATKDPDGNCTNGIDRVFSPHYTIEGDDESKLNDWPRNKYLNVWVVNGIGIPPSNVAGYAYFPSSVTGIGFTVDGVLILNDYVGSIGTGSANNSRALTHEIGHYLALEHCWGNNNSPGVACGDDGIGDTPITKGYNLFCPALSSSAICNNQSIAPVCDFDSVTTFSGTSIGNIVSNNTGINLSPFTAVGLSSNPTDSDRFVFSGWGTGSALINNDTTYTSMTGSLNTANYYEFTLTPIPPYWMTLTDLDFDIQRDSLGPRSFAVRSSLDNFLTNMPAANPFTNPNLSIRGAGDEFFIQYDTTLNQFGSQIPLTINAMRVPITFRIYAWNAESNAGDFGIDNITVNGGSGIYENVQNFMEYSYCSLMFTADQTTAMHQTLTSNVSYRNNLPTYANHVATGIDSARTGESLANPYVFPAILSQLPVCAPVACFSANRFYICQGGTVTFSDASWRAPIQSRAWSFPNGTPSTSTVATPTVTFNSWGWQDITLISTSAGGSDTLMKHNYVFVAPPWYDFFGPFSYGFEDNAFPNGMWIVDNAEGSYPIWQQTNTAAATGSKSVVLKAFGTERNLIDAFISPAYDLSTCSNATLSFKYSCASAATTFVAGTSEEFRFYVSTNCGQTWLSRGAMMNGSTLANAGYSATSYTPNSLSPWTTRTITLQPGDLLGGKTRFRFEYTSGYSSNNMYIDDINLSATNGVNELGNYNFDLMVYPNPAHGENIINIAYSLSSQEKIKITLVDMIGREIVIVNNSVEQPGDKVVTVDKNALNLNSGVYLVKISNGSSYTTSKLVIAN